MSRFTNGWVKLHRKIADNEWTQILDINSKGLFIELLLMANYKPTRATRGNTLVTIQPGQILTSIKELTTRLKTSRFIVESRIKLLCDLGTITRKTDNLGTIITICKYVEYQSINDDSPETDLQTDLLRIEEVKELKKLNKGKKAGIPPEAVDNFLDVYFSGIEKRYGKRPKKTSILSDLASQIIADIGLERSIALATHFCASNREYYVKRAHSLDVMLKDLAIIDMFV